MAFETNKKGAAEFFGVSVQALDGWFLSGCPVLSRDKNDRIESLDLRAMVQWRIDRAGDGGELDRERTRLTKAQADKTELEVSELRAQLVRAPVIELHWQALIGAMRAKLLSIPSKVAPQVVGTDNLARAQDLLQAGVFEALAEIAGDAFPNDVRKRLDMARSNVSSNGGETAAEDDGSSVGKRASPAQRGGQRGAGAVSKRSRAVPERDSRRAE